MDQGKGWVICAKNNAEPQYYSGNWVETDFTLNNKPAFVIHPWNAQHVTILQAEPESITLNPADLNNKLALNFKNNSNLKTSKQQDFEHWVNLILKEIEAGTLQKCVAARAEWTAATFGISTVIELVIKLFSSNLMGFKAVAMHPVFGLWMGISPEVFCAGIDSYYFSMSLAGTVSNPNLSFTSKETEEQNIVTQYIEKTVLENHGKLIANEETQTLSAGHLTHLVNKINFELEANSIPKLLTQLHPTPAVGGFPKTDALSLIQENENLNRALYAGWWGTLDTQNQMDFYVNLRCAQLFSNGYLTYAGCGINKGSIAEKEWLETVEKMKVIKTILE